MAHWTKTLGDVALVEFIALALVALWQWWRHRARGAGWAALCFTSLAGLGVAGKVLERQGIYMPPLVVLKVFVAALLLVPFFLYCFAASFGRPPRWVRTVAFGLTSGVLLWTAFLPAFPFPGMPTPTWFFAYRVGLSLQWGFLFTFVAARMWTAGHNQPPSARDRMRLLAAGAAGLNVQVIVGMLGLRTRPLVALVSGIVSVIMAALFSLGLVLPASIRAWWRRHDRDAIQVALGHLVTAPSPEDAANTLLPHVAAVVGASRVAWVDEHGDNIAVFGAPSRRRRHGRAPLRDPRRTGRVDQLLHTVLRRDELRLLTGISHLLSLVRDRFAIADRERTAKDALGPSGVARRSHRPAQPHTLPRQRAHHRRGGRRSRFVRGGDVPRSRPVQADQRRDRPRRRRRGAANDRRPPR